MKEFKIGGKITLDDNTAYRIVDMVQFEGKDYLFCCTVEKPILPKVLEQKRIGEEVFIKEEKNPTILKQIVIKIMKDEIEETDS